MRLSFSTRGWTDLSWEEMMQTALEMGFSGIEVYNLPKFDPMLDRSGPFHKYQAAATVRQLREKSLSIPCFDTSYDLSQDDSCIPYLQSLMEVAHNTQVPYVVACALGDNEDQVMQNLQALLPKAEALNVTILLKSSVRLSAPSMDWFSSASSSGAVIVSSRPSRAISRAVPFMFLLMVISFFSFHVRL